LRPKLLSQVAGPAQALLVQAQIFQLQPHQHLHKQEIPVNPAVPLVPQVPLVSQVPLVQVPLVPQVPLVSLVP